jgi:uncharacterized lipoprotein
VTESGKLMFRRALACGVAIACVGLLSACHSMRGGGCHKPGAYTTAENGAPLKIPPGLKSPDTTQALHVPELNEPEAPARKKGEPCLDAPPPYAVPKPAPLPPDA